jgi:hypothetical protein
MPDVRVDCRADGGPPSRTRAKFPQPRYSIHRALPEKTVKFENGTSLLAVDSEECDPLKHEYAVGGEAADALDLGELGSGGVVVEGPSSSRSSR